METQAERDYGGPAYPPAYAHPGSELRVIDDLQDYFRDYARQHPEAVALTCLAVGFVLGWKLKPW